MTAARAVSLMPDCGGLLRLIALALPAAFFFDVRKGNERSPLYPIGNLLSALPCDVTAAIVIDLACLASARSWLETLTISCAWELVINDDGGVEHPWIQDMFHVRTIADGGAIELVSTTDSASTRALPGHFDLSTVSSDLALPGGNQLVGPDFRLVGISSLQESGKVGSKNGSALGERWPRVQALDGRPVHRFGYRPQDLGASLALPGDFLETPSGSAFGDEKMHQCGFHVDQFVSVTGLTHNDRPLLLVGDPVAQGKCSPGIAADLKRKLDASVLSLMRQGFAIQRNPIPVSPAIDSNKCLPRLYNNVILENALRPGKKQPLVWIPNFGDTEALGHFDEANRDIWANLGFCVVGVSGWSHFTSRNGALRCATKVINRLPIHGS